MPARLILAAALLLTGAVGGCSDSGGSGEEAKDVDSSACPDPTVTRLGVPFRGVSAAFFHTSGGEVRIGVSELSDTVLGDMTQTGVDIGPGESTPEIDRDSNHVLNASESVTVHLDRLAAVSLPAGSYWLVSSNGGRIALHTCPDVTISDVRPADGDPGSAFSTQPSG